MAPMLTIAERLSSSSIAAIFGSGLREPTVRRHEACLPSTMAMSLEPPKPTPTIAGWQASPRLPKRDQRVEIEALDAVESVAQAVTERSDHRTVLMPPTR